MSTVADDCADVFCHLYDGVMQALVNKQVGASTLESIRSDCQPRQHLYQRVRGARASAETTGRIPAQDYELETAVATLLGIHEALLGLGLQTGGPLPQGLARLHLRFSQTGRLNDASEGALILRRLRPATPAADSNPVAGLFPGLRRIGRDDWSQLGLVLPEFRHSLQLDTALAEQITVASLPWFTDPSELTVTLVDPAQNLYSAGPSVRIDRDQRARDGLAALDATDAIIGLVPESTLDYETLMAWRSCCATTAGGHKGKLRWIVVGSGLLSVAVEASKLFPGGVEARDFLGADTKPTNMAVVIDRQTGEVIFTQDKNPGFTMTGDSIRNYNLQGHLSPEVTPEWLESSSRLWSLELPIGRVVILVCEALKRVVSAGALAAALSPDFILTPLLAINLKAGGWPYTSACTLAEQLGASVAVFNSKGFKRNNDLTVSTMLTVCPKDSHDKYEELKWEFKPTAGEDEPWDKRTDAVTPRIGAIGPVASSGSRA